jgi:hypothetical protein
VPFEPLPFPSPEENKKEKKEKKKQPKKETKGIKGHHDSGTAKPEMAHLD